MPNVRPTNICQHATSPRPLGRHARFAHRESKYTRPSRSIIPTEPQPTVTSEDGTRTLRLRQHGSKSLPLPPLMDPIAIEAKERFKQPKSAPEGQDNMTDFQEALAMDANAQALATPVRQCAITKARLPSHFLLSFSTALDPPQATTDNSPPHPRNPTPRLVPLAASNLPSGTSTGSSTYILNRRSLLEHLSSKNRWSTIVTPRMQDAYAKRVGKKSVRVEREWSWDGDMPDVVLKQLRGEVVKRLKECVEDEKMELVVPLREGGGVLDGSVAGVIDLGTPHKPTKKLEAGDGRPVYSLHELFVPEDVPTFLSEREELKAAHRLAIARHPRTVKLLLALERLRMYTTTCER